MEKENDETIRLEEWQILMDEYNNFFYEDGGIFTISLFDKELDQYKLDFDYIKVLIKKLKNFETKYEKLNKDELRNLQNYKDTLLSLNTSNNGIKNIYNKMSNMYYFIDEY